MEITTNIHETNGRSVTEELPETPESLGATAALSAKANAQGAALFFDDPIHIRRALINKRGLIGADTPAGHTCSNIVEGLDNLFGYVRPSWAQDERQTLPWMINQQVKRLADLSPKMLTYQPEAE